MEEPKYPYNWGKLVVDELMDKYARATYFFCMRAEMGTGECRHLLINQICSGNSQSWERVKGLFKSFQSYNPEQDLPEYGLQPETLRKCLVEIR